LNKKEKYKVATKDEKQLSDQALGAIMMALQKSLLEQSDIVPTLKDMKFRESEMGLVVMNPPLVKFGYEEISEEELEETTTPTSETEDE
jgi:flagellar assembly factor FliW